MTEAEESADGKPALSGGHDEVVEADAAGRSGGGGEGEGGDGGSGAGGGDLPANVGSRLPVFR